MEYTNSTADAVDKGARIIEGRCGIIPAHVAAMWVSLAPRMKAAESKFEKIGSKLGEILTGAQIWRRGTISSAVGFVRLGGR